MRDLLMPKEHWCQMFCYLDDHISYVDSLFPEIIANQGEDSRGAKRAYLTQFASHISYQNTLYSAGSPLEEIREIYPKTVDLFRRVWDKSFGYVQMVWMLSIGIMLDIDKKYIVELAELVKRDELHDYLVDFLLHYVDVSWPVDGTDFQFDVPYKELYAVINAQSPESARSLLKEYLEKKWYRGHRDTSWYNDHTDKNSLHDGYWSYESGAIAKILGLDNADWENLKYYPYDMVHYSNHA